MTRRRDIIRRATQREARLLAREAEPTFAEIGRQLGMKGDTVQKIYLRAMRKLRREFERRGLSPKTLIDY